jgi:hypothetical protein
LASTPPAGVVVTVYPVIGVPPIPVVASAVITSVAVVFPTVTATAGLPGTVTGIIEGVDAADARLVPALFVAVTVNV